MSNAINLDDDQIREKLSPIARNTYAKIAASWSLTVDEAAGLIGLKADEWPGFKDPAPASGPLARETIESISLISGIYNSLNIYFSPQYANRWVKLGNRNPYFEGKFPLQVMLDQGKPALGDIRDAIAGWCQGSPLDFLDYRKMKTAHAPACT